MFTARYEWKSKKVIRVDLNCVCSELLVKCKIHHRTGHEGPDREKRYSSTISLTSALDRDGWLTLRPGTFTPRINPLTPNGHKSGRTAPLTSKRCILYIYSTNIGTEYFKHALHAPFFFSSKCSLFHNANLFGSCIIHILYTGVLKLKKKKFRRQRVNPISAALEDAG